MREDKYFPVLVKFNKEQIEYLNSLSVEIGNTRASIIRNLVSMDIKNKKLNIH